MLSNFVKGVSRPCKLLACDSSRLLLATDCASVQGWHSHTVLVGALFDAAARMAATEDPIAVEKRACFSGLAGPKTGFHTCLLYLVYGTSMLDYWRLH